MLRNLMTWLRGRLSSPPTSAIEDFREALLEPPDDRVLEMVRRRVNQIKQLAQDLDSESPQTEPYEGIERRRNRREE